MVLLQYARHSLGVWECVTPTRLELRHSPGMLQPMLTSAKPGAVIAIRTRKLVVNFMLSELCDILKSVAFHFIAVSIV